jgi:hypothetical protein
MSSLHDVLYALLAWDSQLASWGPRLVSWRNFWKSVWPLGRVFLIFLLADTICGGGKLQNKFNSQSPFKCSVSIAVAGSIRSLGPPTIYVAMRIWCLSKLHSSIMMHLLAEFDFNLDSSLSVSDVTFSDWSFRSFSYLREKMNNIKWIFYSYWEISQLQYKVKCKVRMF